MPLRCASPAVPVVGRQAVCHPSPGVVRADDGPVIRQTDAQRARLRYVHGMSPVERQLERFRAINPLYVDGLIAVTVTIVGLVTMSSQAVVVGQVEPTPLAIVTTIATCMPIMFRRRYPLGALMVGCLAVVGHILADFPEGSLPLAVLLLVYSLAASTSARRSIIGLGIVWLSLVVLGLSDAPALGVGGVVYNMFLYGISWAVGFAVSSRRAATGARLREAEERANVERQQAGRMLAEERLRIAQELHDVVAHSMSVIAVQAGVGAHVLTDRPEEARKALEAIAATSRGTLAEMRRLLGVLRGDDGERTQPPAPGIADLADLVAEVRAAGVPVSLSMEGTNEISGSGVELSAYRVVQEALTNVIKHAGQPTRVDVNVCRWPGSLTVEVIDNGRGAAAMNVGPGAHGLVGMRERVELWGGHLTVGPADGGGYRVKAELPYGDES
jgi:signal transduction histidine kinase